MSKHKSIKDLTDKQWEWVKNQYMAYESVRSIAKTLGVEHSSLGYRIESNGWKLERDMEKAEVFKQFKEAKKTSFVKMSTASIKIIQKSLTHLAERSEPPTTREAKDATVILEALDKISRLDEGKPTEITEEKVVDFDEIQRIAAMSPFKETKDDNDDEEPSKPQ
jgi:predicted DNA-binding protein YlxM (UPF0122 family)